jgi:undecaprenyl-diphosphatase
VEIIQAIVMGIVQGLTEFLPISSTAHLRITPALLGWPDFGAAFTAVIQLGTLVAVLVYFRRELAAMTAAVLGAIADPKKRSTPDARLALYIVVGTIPVGVVGVTLKRFIEGDARSLYVISASLILVALVLWFADRNHRGQRTLADVTLRDAIIVGCAQACAVIPGTSRSGATIAAALLIGLRRDDAARFSFLLSIPAIGAAGVFELKHAFKAGMAGSSPTMIGIATLVSLISGYAAIAWLVGYMRKHGLGIFVAYRIALGVALIAMLAAGVLQPL